MVRSITFTQDHLEQLRRSKFVTFNINKNRKQAHQMNSSRLHIRNYRITLLFKFCILATLLFKPKQKTCFTAETGKTAIRSRQVSRKMKMFYNGLSQCSA